MKVVMLYDIDLEDCTTSAKVLDWIAQLGGKIWSEAGRPGQVLPYRHAAPTSATLPARGLCGPDADRLVSSAPAAGPRLGQARARLHGTTRLRRSVEAAAACHPGP